MAYSFKTNDGQTHNNISKVILPSDNSSENVTYIAENEIKDEVVVLINQSQTILPPDNYIAMKKAVVTVSGQVTVQEEKIVEISSASGIVEPDDGYDAMKQVTYAISELPVSLSASNGTITASGDGIKTETITDNNLTSQNIKKNVSIFGVTGAYDPVIPPAGNVTLDISTTKTTYYVGDNLSDIIDDITAVLQFPDGETTMTITDKTQLTAYNITTEGDTIGLGENEIRIGFGGIYDNITINGIGIILTMSATTMPQSSTAEQTITATSSYTLTGQEIWSADPDGKILLFARSPQDDDKENFTRFRISDHDYSGQVTITFSRDGHTASCILTITE